MRIRFVALPLLLLFALAFAGCQQTEPGKPAVAVVDMSRLLTESEPGKAGMAFLEGLQSDMQNKLNAIQERLEKNDKDEDAQRELQMSYMTFQTRMGKEQQNVAGQLYDMLQKVLGEYRAAHGYQVIISREVVASFDAKVDVTDAVLAEVNKQNMTFIPLEQDDAAPAAEKAQAAKKPASTEKKGASAAKKAAAEAKKTAAAKKTTAKKPAAKKTAAKKTAGEE